METPRENEFTFISVSNPNAPEDPDVRKLIRKQAMRNAADARIRRGNHGKEFVGQYPVFEDVVKSRAVTIKIPRKQAEKRRKNETHQKSLLTALTSTATTRSSLLQTSFELMSMKYGFDALDISTLASVHMNRAARQEFLENPSQLAQILTKRKRSYFSYLPSRYGYSTCLNDATDCLVSRVRQILSPDGGIWDKTVLSLYCRALNSLQAAIQCSKLYMEADVLCATAILALYEFLEPSHNTAWSRHALGIANLIKIRGPENFKTEFEKAILKAQIGPIMTEAILNNERCFLANDTWQPVFQSLVSKDSLISENSQIVIELLGYLAQVSGLLKDVTDVVCRREDDDEALMPILRAQILEFWGGIREWETRYEPLYRISTGSNSDGVMACHWVTIGVHLLCSIFGARLLGAISRLDQRIELEYQVQDFADQAIRISEREKSKSREVGLGLAQKVSIARATKATALEWRETSRRLEDGVERDGMIEKWKFVHWCELFGRRTS